MIKIDDETRTRFRAILGQFKAYVRSKPTVTREELIAVGTQSGVTALTISEWIDRATDSLFADGVLLSKSFYALAHHLILVTEQQLNTLSQKIIAYAEDHPLTWMIEGRRVHLQEQITVWEQEPDMVENMQKAEELDRLHRELEALG